MDEKKQKQVEMHTDFFDRCKFAIDNQFYYEAILMEYAAIEARLEVICGIVGFPCSKECDFRDKIQISHRIECLRAYRRANPVIFEKTKLAKNFFTDNGELNSWIKSRNGYVHGLYKDEIKYRGRVAAIKNLAQDGLEYSRLLYNEAKRLRRIMQYHPEALSNAVIKCKSKKCIAFEGI